MTRVDLFIFDKGHDFHEKSHFVLVIINC